jgi:phosphate transport system permease protein
MQVNVQGETPQGDAPLGVQSSFQRRGYLSDLIARNVFLVCAILIVLVIVGVFVFLGINSFQLFSRDPAHAFTFFSSTAWQLNPESAIVRAYGPVSYGSLGFLLGSVVTTLFSILIVTPLAFGMALFMTELSPKWLTGILRPLLEIFTGMPSVVIGFLGLTVLVPWLTTVVAPITGGRPNGGLGWGAAILVLVVMVLPTVISISIDVLNAVPHSVREASLALGSTRWQMMKDAVLPAATTGLATAVVLGMARAIGETFAVAMVLKGSQLPSKLFSLDVLFQPNITITYGIVGYFAEAPSEAARSACFMLGLLLLFISFLFICVSRYLASRSVYK